jgi:hypothetical protein
MDVEEGPSSIPTKQIRSNTIQAGQLVLLKLPGGHARSVKLDKDSYSCSFILCSIQVSVDCII